MKLLSGLTRMALGLSTATLLWACSETGGVVQTTTQKPPPPVDTGTTQPDPGTMVTLPGATDRVVRVAVLLPTSSPNKSVAETAKHMSNAAQLAAIKSGNKKLLLITKDTGGTYEGAQAAAQQAVRDGAEVVIGPLFADAVRGAQTVTAPLNIPMISFSTDTSVAGGNVYLLSHLPETEIARVTSYAYEQGYNRYASLTPQTAYGEQVKFAFESQVNMQGSQMVAQETYHQAVDAMMQPAKSISKYAARRVVLTPRNQPPRNVMDPDNGFQAILMPEQGRLLRALAPLMPYYNVDIRRVKLLGVSNWNNPILAREPALNGAWFAAPDPKLAQPFKNDYERAFGKKPVRHASVAYDAALLTAFLATNPPGQRFTHENITDPQGFSGADGLFRINKSGRVERGLAILQMSPGGISVIDPAPTSFEDAFTGF